MKSIKLKNILESNDSVHVDESVAGSALKGYLVGALGAFLLKLFGNEKKKHVDKIKKEFDSYIDNKIKTDPEFKSILDRIKAGETDASKLMK